MFGPPSPGEMAHSNVQVVTVLAFMFLLSYFHQSSNTQVHFQCRYNIVIIVLIRNTSESFFNGPTPEVQLEVCSW